MKQTVKLNEQELHHLIYQCVNEVLNEDVDERNLFTNVRDTLGAVKDTFKNPGSSFQAHKNYRNMQTSNNDIAKLNKKYGVQNDAMNTNQMAKSMASQEVEQLETEKQNAIAQVTAKYDQKIEAARQKAMTTAQEYRSKRGELNTQRNQSRNRMNQAIYKDEHRQDPYAGYNGNHPANA